MGGGTAQFDDKTHLAILGALETTAKATEGRLSRAGSTDATSGGEQTTSAEAAAAGGEEPQG